MKKHNWDLEKSLKHVQKSRMIARPNSSFMEQLKILESSLNK